MKCAIAAIVVLAELPLIAWAQGARDGYVDSRVCANCHQKIYENYRRTGMARSFYRPRPETAVEDYSRNNHFYHAPSDTHFEMIEQGGRYFQKRYQIGFDGKQSNVDEKEIDFVMGSGAHVRTYLHRTNAGALLELPLAWYAEKGGYWAMNPGYDRPDQPDARRPISYECMFCHNAYPEIPAGHDQLRAEPIFSDPVPAGIDCQRCHGPGRQHVEIAGRAGATREAIRNAIVNPARLSHERRMEVCMQCHLETTSFPFARSILKFGRGPFSYRPGEPLSEFELFFDRPDRPGEDRFQIVNSAYGLRKSACFLKSGALECTTCHDPHDTPPREQAAEHYNSVCLGCHSAGFRVMVESGKHTREADCVGCHMPKRRTDDVVHAVMTDHSIRRRPQAGDLLAEKKEPHEPEILYRGEVMPYYPKPLAATADNALYLALAQVLENNNADRGIEELNSALKRNPPAQAEFYIGLADARLARSESRDAAAIYQEALRRKTESLAGWLGLGNAFEQAGQLDQAADAFRRATQLYAANAAAWRKLGEVRVKQGQRAEAAAALRKSAELDSEVPETHYALGTLLSQAGGDAQQAEASFREAIRLQPDYAQARMNLAILLFQRGEAGEADYQFAYAVRVRPGYALGHFNYGLMLANFQRIEQARSQFEAALRADPKYAEAHQELGELAELSGKLEVALREYADAVRLRPDLTRSQLGLGAALLRKGNIGEARQHLGLAAAATDPAIRESAQRLLKETIGGR